MDGFKYTESCIVSMVEYRDKYPRPHSVPKRVNTQSLGITEETILSFFFFTNRMNE